MGYILRAQQEFFYDGKTLKVDDKFEAVDPDANILCCLGKAVKVENYQPQKLQTTAMKAEEPAPVAEETTSRKRRYMRRDMVPEE